MFEDANVIYSYTRKQAIDDGVLVDISEKAKEMGLKYPTVCTTGVWETLEVPANSTSGESTDGRLHDLVWMLLMAIKGIHGTRPSPDRCDFSVKMGNKKVDFYSICGPGDTAEPVITIMLPHED